MSAASDLDNNDASAAADASRQDGGGDAAVFYDGTSNRKRRVTLRAETALEIVEDGAIVARWPFADIRRAEGTRGLRLLSVSALPLARLEIGDAETAKRIAALCPALDAAQSGKQTGRIVAWSVAAACSIILVVLFGIPLIADRLAPMVPYAMEKRIGEAVDRQVRTLLRGDNCTNPEGVAAFNKMVESLRVAGGMTMPLKADVYSSKIPNAVALPGGQIYLFDGLLQRANNPDEIAGVIAHELGHVHHRDGLRRIIQTGGSSFLIGLFFGDVMGGGAVIFASRSILEASHTREGEFSADGFAIDAMHKLGRSPRPLGEILVRLTGKSELKTIIDSHPVSAERLDRMKKDDRPVTGAPILTDREWQALKNVCRKADPVPEQKV